jgi:hypothetical protein
MAVEPAVFKKGTDSCNLQQATYNFLRSLPLPKPNIPFYASHAT